VQCAGLAAGFASRGCFLCVECRIDADSSLECTAAEEALLLELTTSDEARGAALADYRRLETEYALRPEGEVPLMLPSDDEAAFERFLRWLAECEERARSLPSVWAAASQLTSRTRGEDITRRRGLREVFYGLLRRAAVDLESAAAQGSCSSCCSMARTSPAASHQARALEALGAGMVQRQCE